VKGLAPQAGLAGRGPGQPLERAREGTGLKEGTNRKQGSACRETMAGPICGAGGQRPWPAAREGSERTGLTEEMNRRVAPVERQKAGKNRIRPTNARAKCKGWPQERDWRAEALASRWRGHDSGNGLTGGVNRW
jgi:hypothetical protein